MSEDGNDRLTEDESTRGIEPSRSDAPERIGSYRILQKIGEGGMGSVYEAEQESPVRRRVALKLIKKGMDTRQVVARFEAERQALALMNHPNVARVYEAGETADGRPYFVMEYVKGVPVTEHCDAEQMTTRERLELFMEVCDGVQHAHQKGIIHRDIKPSNILVEMRDGKSVPKIIDFGVAKATDQRLTEQTLFTELGQFVGTPAYMSPEQSEVTQQDVDTRTDVYSLGVVLYELLVGALPFDPRELRKAGFDEMRRKIREEEPPRPSTRVTTLGLASADTAKNRRTEITALKRQISGDLDWITIRALEKNRNRRYDSPKELSEDIRRHLHDEPVTAGAPTFSYRFGKFVRRHRLMVGSVGLIFVALILGLAGTTYGLIRAVQAESAATQHAATAERVSEFLVGLFQVSDPGEARGNSVTAREILDEGAAHIVDELGDEPEVQATLMYTMGRVYHSLGLYESSQSLLEQALDNRRQVLREEHPDVAESINKLAQVLEGQGKYDEAEPLHREALELRRAIYGEQHGKIAESLNNLAALLKDKGDLDAAEAMYREALRMDEELGTDPLDMSSTMGNLALLLKDKGDYEAAEPLFRESLEIKRQHLGEAHPEVAISINNLATLHYERGEHETAAELFEQALDLNREMLGDRHPEVGNAMSNLGTTLEKLEEHDRAESLFREALSIQREMLGDDHPRVALSLSHLAGGLMKRGDATSAEPMFREALGIVRGSLDPGHWLTAQVHGYLGTCLVRLERYDEAETELLSSLEGLEAALGGDHPRVDAGKERLVDLYDAWGRPDRAEPYRPSPTEDTP